MKKVINAEWSFEENLINKVYNSIFDLQVRDPNDNTKARNFLNEQRDLKVIEINEPNPGYHTPILNISLRPVNLTTNDDFKLFPAAYISIDSTVNSAFDAIELKDSGERYFVRLEFALNSNFGPPSRDSSEKPAGLTLQTALLMSDLRKLLSRNRFVNFNLGEGVYLRDAGIINSFFDERVRNSNNELYIVQFMVAFSYPDAENIENNEVQNGISTIN